MIELAIFVVALLAIFATAFVLVGGLWVWATIHKENIEKAVDRFLDPLDRWLSRYIERKRKG